MSSRQMFRSMISIISTSKQCRLHRHCCRRQLLTAPNNHRFFSTSPSNEEPPDDSASTIIQGPSLLTSTGAHRPSPSLFYLPGLRSLPFWTAPSSSSSTAGRQRVAFNDPIVASAIRHVESNYDDIRSEYFAAVLGQGRSTDLDNNDGSRKIRPLEPDYDVSTRGGEHADDALHGGGWDWHSYILNGVKNERFRERCPKTAAVVDDLEKENMLFGTPFGFCFFSTLHSKSHIKPHSGPMNLRLRLHLPLLVPKARDEQKEQQDNSNDNQSQIQQQRPVTGIQVADQTREWIEGSSVVLDDSYVHEVWNDSTDSSRVLFLLDLWHPDVRSEERERIGNMFDFARGKGWIGGRKPE